MSDLDNEKLKATRELNTKEIEKSSGNKEKQEKSSCIEKSADEIFEDIDEVGEIYKIELMKSGKIKIKYRDKYFKNFMCEIKLERKKDND